LVRDTICPGERRGERLVSSEPKELLGQASRELRFVLHARRLAFCPVRMQRVRGLQRDSLFLRRTRQRHQKDGQQ
jgi:hypothetical protein